MSCTDRERELVERHESTAREYAHFEAFESPCVVHLVWVPGMEGGEGVRGYVPPTLWDVDDAETYLRLFDLAEDAERRLLDHVEEFGPVEAPGGGVYKAAPDGGLVKRGVYPRLARLYGEDGRLEWAN